MGDPSEATGRIAGIAHRGDIVDDVEVSQQLHRVTSIPIVVQRLQCELSGVGLGHWDAPQAFGCRRRL